MTSQLIWAQDTVWAIDLGAILADALLGLVIGALARLVVPGRGKWESSPPSSLASQVL